MKFHCHILFVLLFMSQVLFGQIPNKIWDRTYGGNRNDEFVILKKDRKGDLILAGYSNSDQGFEKGKNSFAQTNDFWILKTDTAGTIIWQETMGANGEDKLADILVDNDNSLFLFGYSNSDPGIWKSSVNRGGMDYWMLKLDQFGNKIYDMTIGGSSNDILTSAIQTKNGDILLGGYSSSPNDKDKISLHKGKNDFWVIRYDILGNKIWDKTFGGERDDVLIQILEYGDDVLLCGYSASTDTSTLSFDKSQVSRGNEDYWVLRVGRNGNVIWDKTIGGDSSDILTAAMLLYNDDILLAGTSFSGKSGEKTQDAIVRDSSNMPSRDYWLVRIDSSGTVIWDKTIGSYGIDIPHSLASICSKGAVVSGLSDGNKSGAKSENRIGKFDMWILEIDENGEVLWDMTYGGPAYQFHPFLLCHQDIFLAGQSASNTFLPYKSEDNRGLKSDFWLIRFADTFHKAEIFTKSSFCLFDTLVFLDKANFIAEEYLWSLQKIDGSIGISDTHPVFRYVSNDTGSYKLKLELLNACFNKSTEILFDIVPAPILDLGNDTFLPAGSVLYLDAGNPGAAYVWNNGDTVRSIVVDKSGLYWVKVSYGDCFRIDSIRVQIAGGYEQKEPRFEIFPNPCNTFLIIRSEAKKTEGRLSIYDQYGKNHKDIYISEEDFLFKNTLRIDVSDLPKGVLLLLLENEEGRVVKKIIHL
jgi:hypothetical protein